ncbi:hypothetical protein VNI00_001214 [Paramarasmius palmivorus]|uniref:Uncharacterized protein n=1 Tax=Paramarasmius palmivorus TaxID=297713 RepID=A0AAW0E930_9AGAR
MTTIARPPLRDIPLSEVPVPSDDVPKSNKRPLSPDGPSIFSPAKRRILCEEGILSPTKMLKSPFRTRPPIAPSFSDLQPPARPGSGATKRTVKTGGGPATTLVNLASSPELVSRTPQKSSSAHHNRTPNPAEDDFFATPDRLPSATRSSNDLHTVDRALPACSEPDSIHYPGFQVHRDPFTVILEPVDIEPLSAKATKENFPPKKALKKPVMEAARVDGKTLFLTPESKKREMEKLIKAKSTPATPKKVTGKGRLEPSSPTPQRPTVIQTWVGTPILSAEERLARKQLMVDEVEDGDDDDGLEP